MKHSEIVSKMTLEQKAKFVSGYDYWHLCKDESLGLPEIMVTDGPNGLRKKDPNGNTVGLGGSYPSTCFPGASTVASSWDRELIKKEGEALGQECLKEKVSVLLGPGTNIKRSPTCGRNFEYFSEDPLLAGECSAAWINGLQSKGVGASLKHFACNSQEAFRMVINEVVDERAMRELYLTAFEIAVKKAQPWTIMSSYNRINGVYASEQVHLQQEIARGEWGFEGLFVTDWGGSVDRVPGLMAGTDLEMPTSGDYNMKKIMEAVRKGDLDEKVLDERVDTVVDLIIKSKPHSKRSTPSMYRSTTKSLRQSQRAVLLFLRMRTLFFLLSPVRRLQLSVKWLRSPVIRVQAHQLSIPLSSPKTHTQVLLKTVFM